MTPTPTKKQMSVSREQRRVKRIYASKLVKKVDEVIVSVNEENITQARALVAQLDEVRSFLAKVDSDILPHVDDNEIEAEVGKSMDYDTALVEAAAVMHSKMEGSGLANPQGFTPPPDSSISKTPYRSTTKLPTYEPEKYDGNPLTYDVFWDDFCSSVDARTDLSTIDKFKLLKRAWLKDEALRVADGYLLTAANYVEVKAALKERFGDPDDAIHAHFKELIALPAATHDLGSLQRTRDICEAHVRSLDALGLGEDGYGCVFVPILLSKFPKFVKMELYRKKGSDKWTLSILRKLIKDEIAAREKTDRMGEISGERGGSKTNRGRTANNRQSDPNERLVGTATALVLNAGKGKPLKGKATSSDSGCAFCGGDHIPVKCSQYTDSFSRQSRVRDRCYACLRKGHSVKDCQSSGSCFYCRKLNHHSSLCHQQFGPKRPKTPNTSAVASSLDPGAPLFQPNGELATIANSSKRTGLGVIKSAEAIVKYGTSEAKAQLVFDDGSTISFIRKDLVQRLGARPVSRAFTSLGRFLDTQRQTFQWDTYELEVILEDGRVKTILVDAVESIVAPIQLVPLDLASKTSFTNLRLAQPPVNNPTLRTVDILIGLDHYYDFVGVEQCRVDGLVVMESSLGHIVSGYLNHSNERGARCETQLFIQTRSKHMNDVGYNLERLWKLEDIGVKDDPYSVDDDIARAHFDKHVTKVGDRYQVCWPYKTDNPEISNTYGLALGRLRGLVKKLRSKPGAIEQYDGIFQDQLRRGIIESAPTKPKSPVYYIPHHAVVKQQSTSTKVRVVYDASAKARRCDLSLNESMHRGPVILNDLGGLLIRFRLHPIAMISDVEKAFHMVQLAPEDRDVTCFLWLKDISKPVTTENMTVLRFVRIPFGVVASPFLLGAVITHHMALDGGVTATDILQGLYVDNVQGGRYNAKEASAYYKDAKQLMSSAGMNLRQWYSNCREFTDGIPASDRGQGESVSVLGVQWDTVTDSLSCPVGSETGVRATMREVLSAAASLFDPCGWFSPVSVTCRMLMQSLWKLKSSWDDELPPDLQTDWMEIQKSLRDVPSCRVPRMVIPNQRALKFELHCFVDASAKAYGSVVYLVSRYTDFCQSSLLFAKARVAPVKAVTIPRLELMAAVVGSRLLTFVKTELHLEISLQVVYSDSQCVLAWIAEEPSTSVFVRNRIKQIRETCPGAEFRYVRTDQNPADIASRGCKLDQLAGNSFWWHGPRWLVKGDQIQEQLPIKINHNGSCKRCEDPTGWVNETACVAVGGESSVFDIDRFSSLQKLLNTTAYVFRVPQIARGNQFPARPTPDEVDSAKTYWIRQVQSSYLTETDSVGDLKPVNMVKQLGLFVDDMGVVRSRGRYANADIGADAICPIFLPKNHRFSSLVIQNIHRNNFHVGVQHVLSILRGKYWIPNGRAQVKMTLNQCTLCRKYDGGPFRVPDPPPWPSFRVSMQKPFSCVGLDYLGPLLVRAASGGTQKAWICLFTCTSTRALHLEVASSLSANDFVLCLRRFVASRGVPKLIISDNATQFHSAESALAKLWKTCIDTDVVSEFSSANGIAWRFITEAAPWMGGFYERLVSPVKSALKRCLDKRLVSADELSTIIQEITATLNTRPLAYVASDAEGICITPAHLLMNHNDQFPDFPGIDDYVRDTPTTENVIKRWTQGQKVLKVFWQLWRDQYLLSLRERALALKQRGTSEVDPSVGQVVLIKEHLPRGKWRMARISKLLKSADGLVRSAELVLSSGNTMKRALRHLFPLESSVSVESLPHREEKNPERRVQPLRAAATNARQRLKILQAAEEDDDGSSE